MSATPKAKAPIAKLEPGTDLVGPIKFASFYPEKPNEAEPDKPFAAQWGLTGTFDGTEMRVFIAAHQLEGALPVVREGSWPDGNPKYKWTGTGPFRLHKYVKDKRHYVTILPADGGAAPAQVGNGAAGPARSTVATPSIGSHPSNEKWDEVERVYQRCAEIARHTWGQDDIPPDAMVRAANGLMIEAGKRGLTVPPTAQQQAEKVRDTLDSFVAMPSALGHRSGKGDLPDAKDDVPDPEVPAWMQVGA
jgi:hypothetical protein